MIPFLDLKAPYIELKEELDDAINRVLNSGWYIGGSETEAFEHEYATYCNTNYTVGVANGLDAIHLALKAMDVGPGDEVIVPSFTFIATANAPQFVGAKPVFADIERETLKKCRTMMVWGRGGGSKTRRTDSCICMNSIYT